MSNSLLERDAKIGAGWQRVGYQKALLDVLRFLNSHPTATLNDLIVALVELESTNHE